VVISNIAVEQAPLKALSPELVANLLLELCVILGLGHIFAEVMRRLKQPTVVGNILAGVLLGPSVLGHYFPALSLAIFPHDQGQANLLAAVSWVGLLLLMLSTGLEINLNLIKRRALTCALISGAGLLLPLVSGFFLGYHLPASVLAHPEDRLPFSLFIAVAMSISALPVLALTLKGLNVFRRDLGQMSMGAAMLDDTIGWVLLSVVTGLYLSREVDVRDAAKTFGIAFLFLLVSFLAVGPLVRWIVDWTDKMSPGAAPQLSILLFLGLVGSAITDWLGLEAALGIFVVGILVALSPNLRDNTVHGLELVVASFLAPIYFGLAGLKLDLWSLTHRDTFEAFAAIFGVACFGKIIGVYFGAWLGGFSRWERLAMSFGLNARGGTEIIVATVGLSVGLLTQPIYSAIVVMAILTALMAGPTMSWALSHWVPPPEPEDPSKPKFIFEESIDEPATALDLIEKEQLGLAQRLLAYPDAVRAVADSPQRQEAAKVHEPFLAVAKHIERCQQALVSRSLGPNQTERLTRLQSRMSMLTYLEDSLRTFTLATEGVAPESRLGKSTSPITEGLDFLLLMMVDVLTLKEDDLIKKFGQITGNRGDLFERIRKEYLAAEVTLATSERAHLFQMTSGFEQILWVMQRIGLTVIEPRE
jgi:Kef-type K+ transport system membrane component KefB